MILDSRQIKFDVMLVPDIERWTTEIEFNRYNVIDRQLFGVFKILDLSLIILSCGLVG